MALKRIKSGKARGLLGQIMDEVYYKGNDFIIERGKKAMAVIISIEEYEKLQKERELYRSTLEIAEVLNDKDSGASLKQDIQGMGEGDFDVEEEPVKQKRLPETENSLTFFIKHFEWDNEMYILKEKVLCYKNYEDNLWIYKVPRYKLHSFSENDKEAFLQLNEEFAFLCHGLLNESDENLTVNAKVLRDLIKFDLLEIMRIK